MGPDELVGREGPATVDTEDVSGTIVLAETSVLSTFFPSVCFLALVAEGHLLAM